MLLLRKVQRQTTALQAANDTYRMYADAATARTNLGLGTAATTDATAYATAAQGTTADNALPAANVSTFGGTLIDDADAATARTTLGLGTADNVTFNNITGNLIGNILDSNENELVKGTTTASAVNEITVTNAAIGNGPTISASGDDTDIDLNIEAKGTGVVNTSGDLTVGGAVTFNG